LIKIWESLVRAIHDFLSEEDIAYLRPLILETYFDAVDLQVAIDSAGEIVAVIGVAGGNIEMLFVSPETRGKGVGRLLTMDAIENQGAIRVDVNEQNDQAVGFYLRLGFTQIGRSPLDGQGRPFPILHFGISDH